MYRRGLPPLYLSVFGILEDYIVGELGDWLGQGSGAYYLNVVSHKGSADYVPNVVGMARPCNSVLAVFSFRFVIYLVTSTRLLGARTSLAQGQTSSSFQTSLSLAVRLELIAECIMCSIMFCLLTLCFFGLLV